MDMTTIVMVVLAAVFLGLYLMRRRSRLSRDDYQ
jgi:hypothetical protein